RSTRSPSSTSSRRPRRPRSFPTRRSSDLTGQNGADLRARFAIDNGQPMIRDLTVKKSGGQLTTLGKNLTPEYHVVSGIRRLGQEDRKSTRLNSSHVAISYAVFCLKKKKSL